MPLADGDAPSAAHGPVAAVFNCLAEGRTGQTRVNQRRHATTHMSLAARGEFGFRSVTYLASWRSGFLGAFR